MRKELPKRVSLSTIAERAGVSVSTVSRIANGQLDRANPSTVARVQKLLAALDYRPDGIARSLRRRESRIIAMLAPNLDNPAMGAIATSTETALRAAGYVMILCDTHDEPALQDEYLAAMRAQFVQGFVIVSAVQSAGLSEFIARGEPAVFVGRRPPKPAGAVPFVGIDNHAAGAEAAEFLLRAGVREPALLHSSLTSSAIADRTAGFYRRLASAGIRRADIRSASSNELHHLSAGYDAARKLAADGAGWPRALMCTSDLMAYGAYRVASEMGVRVPRDCLIVGVDDNPINDWIAPWLSSIRIPYADFGAAVLEQLEAAWGGKPPTDRILPHRLIERHRTQSSRQVLA